MFLPYQLEIEIHTTLPVLLHLMFPPNRGNQGSKDVLEQLRGLAYFLVSPRFSDDNHKID
jgi:hypothetical protein